MKKLLITTLFLPLSALAAWWNPFTWNEPQNLGATPALTVPQGGTGTTTFTGGYLLMGSTQLRITEVATTSVTCTGTASCTGFTVVGTSPITISATGGSGVGTVSTSTSPTIGNLAYWTSKDAWPETLGTVATTSLTATLPLSLSNPISVIGDTASVLTVDLTGYVPTTRTITVAGTANQIDSNAGAQDLSANRTWTLSLPNNVIFPNTFSAHSGTSTLFSSASSTVGNLTVGLLSATSTATSTFIGGVSSANAAVSNLLTVNRICFTTGECMSAPNVTGSQITLFNHNQAMTDIATYESLYTFPPSTGTETDESCSADADVAGGYCDIDSYVSTTTDLQITEIPSGVWDFRKYSYVNNTAGNSKIESNVYKRNAAGTETFLFQATSTDINSTSIIIEEFSSAQNAFTFLPTDRIVTKVKGWTDQTTAKTIHFVYGSNNHYSRVVTPINVESQGFTKYFHNEGITGLWSFSNAATTTFSDGIESGTKIGAPYFFATSTATSTLPNLNWTDAQGGNLTTSVLSVTSTTSTKALGVGSTALGNNVAKITPLTGLTVSNSESVGGILNVNLGTTDSAGGVFYTNSTGSNRLISVVCDAATFTGNCFHVRNDGTKTAVNIAGAPTGQGLEKLTVTSGADSDASALSIEIDDNDAQGMFFQAGPGWTGKILNFRISSTTEVLTMLGSNGYFGLATSSPYARLSVVGEVVGANFTATTTATNTFPHLTSTNATTTRMFYSVQNYLASTTAGSIVVGSLTATSTLSGPFYHFFSYASTSWTGTTTQLIGPAMVPERWESVSCETNAGTANVRVYDGTNSMMASDSFPNASTTIGTFTFTTNNTFTAGESRRIDIGTPTASISKVGCTAKIIR